MKFDDIKLGEDALGLGDVSEDAFQCLEAIESNVRHIKDKYIELGFHLREMRKWLYYVELGYSDFYECVEENFHLDKSAASRCIGVWEEFADQRTPLLLKQYEGYSYSQLVEMLPLKEDQRKKVTVDMSVAQIRAYKKSLKAPKDKPEKETVATSQLKDQEVPEALTEEKAVRETVASQQEEASDKNAGCPPGISSCVRLEWGTDEVSQEKGRKECKKCWDEHEKRKKIFYKAADQKLSAYGTELKSYPPGSLVATKGCKPNHDCFLCHLDCDIRQQFCCCVEAPCGDPFPCTVIDHYKEIKEELAENCQFVNLELAEKRNGDKEPVPCCFDCTLECEHRCERSAGRTEQSPFPDLKNMVEREEFVNGYKDWKIWCKNELTEETFYRYDLPDGAAIVVKSYLSHPEWLTEETEETELYLLTPGYRHFADCKKNMTAVKEYLKDLKNKASGRKKK